MKQKHRSLRSKIWGPPSDFVRPPISSRPQTLPLNELRWEVFQQLCARLARRSGDVEHCQEYGVPGQDQEGIDIYVRLRSSLKYSVWQCKRYKTVKKADIKCAVDEFLDGDWVERSDEFVMCVSARIEDRDLADEIESQSPRLREKGVALVPKGITQLSENLKQHPDLVDDFLGREWVREFCGEEAAAQLSRRILTPEQVVKLRTLLRKCYAQHFESVDPGIPSLTSVVLRGPQPLPLSERFILPDILELKQLTELQRVSKEARQERFADPGAPSSMSESQESVSGDPIRVLTTLVESRHPALDWIVEGELSVIIGDPGIGKSALFRYLLLDLLSTDPKHESLSRKWGDRLPVWVPFPMWTRMVEESESNCSLQEVLKVWLTKVNAPSALLELVQNALEDARLLLFIDGLDEWSNETAARTAVILLEQFVGERSIPAIVSSRPLGFERLGGLSGKWRRAKLAGFTKEQQRDFAYRWFLHQSQASSESDSDSTAFRDKFAKNQAKQLVEDIQKDSQLAKLAEVPLLLSGLISLSVQRARLPRSRFKAYEELTRLLLQDQPQRREKAAYARGPLGRLNPETREHALACLAYSIHRSSGIDSITKPLARDVLRDFLSTRLHKSAADAYELAEEIITVGAEAIGILIEKSPLELGFPHRAFQEFLTARHLSNLPFEQQKKIAGTVFGDPQWYDVLLCLCHVNTRSGEVDALLDVIRGVKLPPESAPARQSFMAEVAFGDLHCSAPVASNLAKEVFAEIEVGAWMPLRERLLEHALDGLFSDVLRDDTEAHVQRWYPERHNYRTGVYQAMATWPRETETLEALWGGLFAEEVSNQRAAAEAIARLAGGDVGMRDKLLQELSKPVEPIIAAFILHALCLGWPQTPKLDQLLKEARLSLDTGLRVIAIKHRVQRTEHDSQDRESLLQLAVDERFGMRNWQDDAVEALVNGWPNDSEIKRMAIESLRSKWAYGGPFSWDFAGPILLRGFPQDDDVASLIADLFKTEDYPQNRFGFLGNWTSLVQAFGGHKLLRDAVDDWLEKRPENTWEAEVCLISKSPRAKKILLRPKKETGMITREQAHPLIEGWGLGDPEVFQALKDLVESQNAPSIAHLFPKIISDKKTCRDRLLALLRTKNDYIATLALKGLVDLGCDTSDIEVANAAIEKFAGQVPSGFRWWGISDLITSFPTDGRVRELALHQIGNRNGDIASVALAYKDDIDIRHKLLESIVSLPSHLRNRVVDRLSKLAVEHDFSRRMLSYYDQDTGTQVKTLAAIGFARSIRERGDDQSPLVVEFSEGIRAVGPDHGGRRQAALAGLIELGRLDALTKVAEAQPNVLHHMDIHSHNVNLALASQMGTYWQYIDQAFGSRLWERVGYIPDEFLEEIVAKNKDINFVEEVIARMARNSGVPLSISALRIRSRLWSGSDQLRTLCLHLVENFHPTNWVETAPRILAAEILSEQFATDPTTRKKLEIAAGEEENASAIIIAICSAWPDSLVLKRFLEEQRYKKLLLPARVHLRCCLDSPNKFAERLGSALTDFTGDIWEFLPSCVRAIIFRLQRDTEATEELLRHLENKPTGAAKSNFPLLLHRTGKDVDRLRTWCQAEHLKQLSGEHLPEFAIDIFTGRIRPVAHMLLEVLTS